MPLTTIKLKHNRTLKTLGKVDTLLQQQQLQSDNVFVSPTFGVVNNCKKSHSWQQLGVTKMQKKSGKV